MSLISLIFVNELFNFEIFSLLVKDEKINSLMRSIDNTNYRYGRATLSLASAGVHKNTADFYCLPKIRI